MILWIKRWYKSSRLEGIYDTDIPITYSCATFHSQCQIPTLKNCLQVTYKTEAHNNLNVQHNRQSKTPKIPSPFWVFFLPHQISVSVSEKTNKSLSSLFASKPTSSSSSSSSTSTLIFDLMATSQQVEPEKHVYSVWAVPPDDVAARLKKLMDSLGSEFGGPKFEPHITVVGAVSLTPEDAVEKFRSACEGRKAYTATVDRVATGTFFYQCVFLLIHPTTEVTFLFFNCYFFLSMCFRVLILSHS